MKKLIPLLSLLTFTSTEAGWFSPSEETQHEHEQRVHAEAQQQASEARRSAAEVQLIQQQQATSHWQTITVVLGFACPILLIAGAALGTRTRSHGSKPS